MLFEYLHEAKPRFCPSAYNIIRNNCNHFSNDLAFFLTGRHIPAKIMNLPNDILATPFGQAILPLLQGTNINLGGAPVEDWERETKAPAKAAETKDGAKEANRRTRVCEAEEYMWTKGRDGNIKAYVGLLVEVNDL